MGRTLVSAERLYLAALGLSGCAAIGSVVLPSAQRGELAAAMVGGTLGAAIGSFSVDTFLLSRPHGWVHSRGRRWIAALVAGSVLLSAAVAALITAVAGVGSYPVATAGAAALTVFNALGSFALRRKRFIYVYAMRAAGGVALITGYALLYVRRDLTGDHWSVAWFAAQAVAAAGVAAAVFRRARGFETAPEPARPDRRADLAAIGKLHLGICAHMLMFRLDQVLLARFAGAGPLGVYALAVAGLEFAQAGAVVTAQRILANRDPQAGPASPVPVVKAALPVAVLAVLALAGLGRLVPDYRDAWLLGLLLLPGCLAIAVDKTWSASLLKQRGERSTTGVALFSLAAAVPCYFVLVPLAGAVGAAVASSFVYLIQAAATRVTLRRQPRTALAAGVA